MLIFVPLNETVMDFQYVPTNFSNRIIQKIIIVIFNAFSNQGFKCNEQRRIQLNALRMNTINTYKPKYEIHPKYFSIFSLNKLRSNKGLNDNMRILGIFISIFKTNACNKF